MKLTKRLEKSSRIVDSFVNKLIWCEIKVLNFRFWG
jgi:hypothetical protein